jgi:hypothetical protein
MTDPITDRRTTPRLLQLPGLLLLAALSTYYWTAYRSVYDSNPPRIVWEHPYFFWFGTWKMFTTRERGHASMEGRALVGGEWSSFDLDAMYPYRWESGPRYARSVFRRSGSRMRTLADATCGRYEATHGVRPDRIRLIEIKWRKSLGQTRQPRGERKREKQKLLLEWDCTTDFQLPQGRRL